MTCIILIGGVNRENLKKASTSEPKKELEKFVCMKHELILFWQKRYFLVFLSTTYNVYFLNENGLQLFNTFGNCQMIRYAYVNK